MRKVREIPKVVTVPAEVEVPDILTLLFEHIEGQEDTETLLTMVQFILDEIAAYGTPTTNSDILKCKELIYLSIAKDNL